jgi:electron transfer flavoprotein beta subunit
VGPGIAAWLDIPVATYVSKIEKVENGRVHLERLVEEGYQMLSVPLPCLITVVKEIAVPRLPTLKGKLRSKDLNIPVFSAGDLDLNPEYTGLKGSPTRVVKIDTPKLTRGGRVISAMDEAALSGAVDALVALFAEKGLV